eukprot:TRINITY_DN28689_c0_g2_i1.p1 TRINITY_DN28689_c0_g2~~TRINITY_DN28689_c0_g2_i1.p1  ORF type:complete len:1101 (-),score=248.22 TRINITY_DN28689_c0_g2_i1:96-3398(-)
MPGVQDSGTPAGSEDDDAEHAVSAVNPMGLPLKELRRLKDQFQDEDGQPIKLTQEQFVDALSSRLTVSAKASPEEQRRWRSELCTLFKKIDASCTDTVNWEEFTNYMLFHVPGFNSGDGNSELSHNAAAAEALTGAWGCGHSDMINDIAVVYDVGTGGGNSGVGSGGGGRRYVTAGRDGLVKVWHPNLTLHRAIDVGQTTSWLSACCWMPKSRKLAVASSSFRIYFYDSTFSPLTHIDHKEGTPLCLGNNGSHESKSSEKEILMVGDDNGYVTVYPMDWSDFGGDQEPKPDGKPDGEGLKVKRATRYKYHSDWVTKVGYVHQLELMVTCSLDGEINLCDVHTNRRKEGRDAVRLHKKGVHSWCWCHSYKFFASGGSDRQIIIWNPYTQKAINYLQGHNAPVLDVLVNDAQHQLISMSVDKVVKVWDILNYQCIQTFTDKTEYKPEDRLTCMAFDEEGPALIMCSSLVNVLPVSVKVETSRTHLAPIIGALYNDVFNQVISGDNTGTVCVWDIQTGKLEFEFRRAHQDHKMTCMAFDESKRCLYTGAEDGAVKHWNFSSGQQLRTFTMKQPAEITSLLWAREGPNSFVVGLAWDRRIYIWPDSRKQTVEPQYVLEDFSGQGHTDDVTNLSRLSSVTGLLATGGDDGYVCFWKIQETSSGSGASSRRYRLSDTTGMEATLPKDGLPPAPAVSDTGDPKGSLRRKHKGGSGLGAETQSAAKRNSMMPLSTLNLQGYPDGPQNASSSPGADGQHEKASGQAEGKLPEELMGLAANAGLGSSGVERMIFLEHKECLLSTHSDQRLRLWSTKSAEFLCRLDLLALLEEKSREEDAGQTAEIPQGERQRSSLRGSRSEALGLVQVQQGAITAIYTDSDENKWLFTGDANGWVRIWDLSPLTPDTFPGHLVRLKEMQPHKMAVTQLQHFVLKDRGPVIVTASADWTIALHSFDGQRIGSFSCSGPHWRLDDPTTWLDQPPAVEEGFRGPEEDDGWGVSPRRSGKGGGAGGHRRDGAAANTGGLPGQGGVGMRTPRGSKVRTRPVLAGAQVHSGQGDFGKLSVVERFRPDLTLAEQERQRLARWHVSDREGAHGFGGGGGGGTLWSSRK